MTELTESLVARLLAKTENGELQWREGVRAGEYTVSFPRSSVGIRSDQGTYTLRLYNDAGMLIDETPIRRDPALKQMMDLMGLARRQAFRVDETLKELLEELA